MYLVWYYICLWTTKFSHLGCGGVKSGAMLIQCAGMLGDQADSQNWAVENGGHFASNDFTVATALFLLSRAPDVY